MYWCTEICAGHAHMGMHIDMRTIINHHVPGDVRMHMFGRGHSHARTIVVGSQARAHEHTRARTHACMHTRMHARTHARTHARNQESQPRPHEPAGW